MRRTLLVTNDFPPVLGGIQRYLADYCARLPADDLEVLTHSPALSETLTADDVAAHDAALPYRVHRHDARVLLPTRGLAAHMGDLIRERGIETIWFGAAAPLGLLGPSARRAGATRVIATTHGHETGWALAQPTRGILRRIFHAADAVTYISDYTRERLSPLIPASADVVHLPSGIDTSRFRPDADARVSLRARYGLGGAPVVVCVSRLVPRKGQDTLIQIWPDVVARVPGARLVIVGWGPYAKRLAELRRASPVRALITLTGPVPEEELAGHVALGDVFAMPCRTRNLGADVEGLGIVYLEAAAAGLPVVAGDSGGAPETVVHGETGLVVPGHAPRAVADAVVALLGDPERARAMGAAGRAHMEAGWTWPTFVARLKRALDTR